MFYFDETIQFEVSMVSSIKDNTSLIHKAIYPNPVNNRMYIPINLNDTSIDYLISTSNKCIQGMAGIGFIICKIESLHKIKMIIINIIL